MFKLYKDRAKRLDRTEYVAADHAARTFAPHYAQLLSAAVVAGDARRSLRAVDEERAACMRAHARRVSSDLAGVIGSSGLHGI